MHNIIIVILMLLEASIVRVDDSISVGDIRTCKFSYIICDKRMNLKDNVKTGSHSPDPGGGNTSLTPPNPEADPSLPNSVDRAPFKLGDSPTDSGR